MYKFAVLVVIIGLLKDQVYGQNFTLNFGYHNYENFTAILKGFAQRYPTKCHLYTIGKTIEYRDIWVMAIADKDPQRKIPLRPEVNYIGGIRGNEPVGKEILLHLIEYMLTRERFDSDLYYILRNSRVHILVSLNPDGFEKAILGDCANRVIIIIIINNSWQKVWEL